MRPDEGAYGIHALVHAHQQREIRRHHVGVRRSIDQQIGHMPLIRLAQQLLEDIAQALHQPSFARRQVLRLAHHGPRHQTPVQRHRYQAKRPLPLAMARASSAFVANRS